MSNEEVNTWESLEAQLKSLFFVRGKEKIKSIERLKDLAEYPAQKLKIINIFVMVQTAWWMNTENMDVPRLMPLEVWRNLVKDMLIMLDILALNPRIRMPYDEVKIEFLENYMKGPKFEGEVHLPGNFNHFVIDLNYQFCMWLVHTDPDSEEHKKWLLQERTLYILCQNILEYHVRINQIHHSAEIARILHTLIYYKTSETYLAFHEKKCDEDKEEWLVTRSELVHAQPILEGEFDVWMSKLSEIVINFGHKIIQDMVKLCDVYHWAMMDNFWKALDGMVRFLKESDRIDFVNIPDFNRALTQLGLCAFRVGRIAEAYTCISWLFQGGKVDFLLGQVYTHLPMDEFDKQPREGYIQSFHHTHIDLKVVKDVYIIGGMLLEFPYADQVTNYCGDIKDVLIASRGLKMGNSSDAIKFIEGLDLWGILKEGDKLLELVKGMIRQITFVNHHQVEMEERQTEVIQGELFLDLTRGLSFLALNHQKIFEDSIYKFSTTTRPTFAQVVPFPVLQLFQVALKLN